MKYILYMLAFLIFVPFTIYAQGRNNSTISESEAEKYKHFLREQRTYDKPGSKNIEVYRDDRNTEVRKLSESIQFYEREARMAKEHARDERVKEKEDLQMSKEKKIYELVNKGNDAKSENEAEKYYKKARELKASSPRKSKKHIGINIR